MLSPLLQRLQDTLENPGLYRPLSAEEQAELFLTLFAPKAKRKVKVVQGIDGKTPEKDKDYLSKETSEQMIADLASKTKAELEALVATKLANVANGKDGKDAVVTPELVASIAELAQSMIVLPDFPTLLTMEPEAIRNALELLPDGEKLVQEAIEGLPERLEAIEKRTNGISGGLTRGGVEQIVNEALSTPTFETVSKNLKAFPNELNYTGENLTSIVYTTDLGTVTKTLAYTGANLTSITLSGDLPTGLAETVKTLAYTGENLTSITYA